MISVGPSNMVAIAVDGCPFTTMVIASSVNSKILWSLFKNLSVTRILTVSASSFTSATLHTGSTTSTTSSSPSAPPGSSFPMVIDLALLVFPDLSVTVPAANDNVIYPLYV